MKKLFAMCALGAVLLTSCGTDLANLSDETNPIFTKGNADSEIVLQEFSDFQCPACKAAAAPVKELVAELGSDIRFEYRHFPIFQIHKNAEAAAWAAEAAGRQGKFYEMHDALFDNQANWADEANPTASFEEYASNLGLDMDKFKADYGSADVKNSVMRDLQLSKTYKVNSTPTFVLNGIVVRPQSYDELKSLIREAVSAAKSE